MPPPLYPGLDRRIAALLQRDVHDKDNDEVRSVLRLRARDACEYCLLPTSGTFNVEHIIPPGKWPAYVSGHLSGVPPRPGRGGPDHLANYAWACPHCNNQKRDAVSRGTGRQAIRLFDPRHDNWPDHFAFLDSSHYLYVVGASPEGRVTEMALGFNRGGPARPLGQRHVAIVERRYPPRWARRAYGL